MRISCLLLLISITISCTGFDISKCILSISGVQSLNGKWILDDQEIMKYTKRPITLEKGITKYWFVKTTYFIDWNNRIFIDKISDMLISSIIIGNKYYFVDLNNIKNRKKGLIDDGSIIINWNKKSLVIKEKKDSNNYHFLHIIENDQIFLTISYLSNKNENINIDISQIPIHQKKNSQFFLRALHIHLYQASLYA